MKPARPAPCPLAWTLLLGVACAPAPGTLQSTGPAELRAWGPAPVALPALQLVDARGAPLDSAAPAWELDPTEVAALNDAGDQLLPLREGEALLWVDQGPQRIELPVTIVFPDAVQLFGASANQKLSVGHSLLLVAVVLNNERAIEAAPVAWESSNSRVLAVRDGAIEALAEGSATITARSGLAAATTQFRVSPEPRRRSPRATEHPVAM